MKSMKSSAKAQANGALIGCENSPISDSNMSMRMAMKSHIFFHTSIRLQRKDAFRFLKVRSSWRTFEFKFLVYDAITATL